MRSSSDLNGWLGQIKDRFFSFQFFSSLLTENCVTEKLKTPVVLTGSSQVAKIFHPLITGSDIFSQRLLLEEQLIF